MFAIVITIHALVCIFLIFIVLIQQGRGGGLIDSLSSAESIFGTKTNTFLVKSTSVFAVIFFFTCLSLAFLSIQKSKSLVETSYMPPAGSAMPAATVPPQAPSQETVPAATAAEQGTETAAPKTQDQLVPNPQAAATTTPQASPTP